MQRRAGRWGWLEAMWLGSIVMLLAMLVWVIKGSTPSASFSDVSAANAEPSVAEVSTMVTNELVASLPPSPYLAPTAVVPEQPGPSVSIPPPPEAPWGNVVCPRYPAKSDIHLWTQYSDVIALGTVVDVQSPRWTTPNGARPANPHIVNETIYSPVVIEVEEYLKGEQPTQRVGIFGRGGQIGQDRIDHVAGCGDTRYTFVQGERVIVFLASPSMWEERYDDLLLWEVAEHYTIEADRVKDWESSPMLENPSVEELRAALIAVQQP